MCTLECGRTRKMKVFYDWPKHLRCKRSDKPTNDLKWFHLTKWFSFSASHESATSPNVRTDKKQQRLICLLKSFHSPLGTILHTQVLESTNDVHFATHRLMFFVKIGQVSSVGSTNVTTCTYSMCKCMRIEGTYPECVCAVVMKFSTMWSLRYLHQRGAIPFPRIINLTFQVSLAPVVQRAVAAKYLTHTHTRKNTSANTFSRFEFMEFINKMKRTYPETTGSLRYGYQRKFQLKYFIPHWTQLY